MIEHLKADSCPNCGHNLVDMYMVINGNSYCEDCIPREYVCNTCADIDDNEHTMCTECDSYYCSSCMTDVSGLPFCKYCVKDYD